MYLNKTFNANMTVKDMALEESKRVQAWIYDLIKLINQL